MLGNKLVLIASAGSAPTLAIGPNFPLAQALGNGRLAVANPASVPAGKYGKAALEALGVWTSVEGRLAPAQDVRAALELVGRREAPLGIVYQTDAVADEDVDIVGTFPASSHPPIIYPLAVTAASTNPTAKSYVAFLQSRGQGRLRPSGFRAASVAAGAKDDMETDSSRWPPKNYHNR